MNKSCETCIFNMVSALDSNPCYSCDNESLWEPKKEELRTRLKAAEKEIRRLRISQLRRMDFVVNDGGRNGFFERCLRFACDVRQKDATRNQDIVPRIMRFNKARRKFSLACLAEIERLRGEG